MIRPAPAKGLPRERERVGRIEKRGVTVIVSFMVHTLRLFLVAGLCEGPPCGSRILGLGLAWIY